MQKSTNEEVGDVTPKPTYFYPVVSATDPTNFGLLELSPCERSHQQIVDDCNTLARKFYQQLGYEVAVDFKFYTAHHPAEKSCWNMAVLAYDTIQGTDVENALDELEQVTPP